METGLVTIVVPVYKAEPYLDQCVESIVKQTYTNLEIILVDDGSPDRCPDMCDNWAKKDSRIHVIHQNNAGLGPARNAGIQAAAGEYIGFIDADDWIEARMYEKLYSAAVQNRADIVVSGHCEVINHKVIKRKPHPLAGTTLSSAEDIMEMRKNLYGHAVRDQQIEAFPMSVCMSIYSRSLLEKNDILFPKLISEDTIFNLLAYRHAKTISFIEATDYCYRKEGQPSITRSLYAEKKIQYRDFLTALAQMAEHETAEDCKLRVKRTVIDHYRLYTEVVGNSDASRKEKLGHIREYTQMETIQQGWAGYPTHCLPIQQRIFHWTITHEQYAAALFLNWIRQIIKKIGQ